MMIIRLTLLLIFINFSSSLSAQSKQVWTEYMLNYPFANSWNIELSGTYSTVLAEPKWRTLDIQVSPEYSISQHVDLMCAVLVGATRQNESLSTLEVREMLGVRFHITPNKRVLSRLLLRFEQRNLQNQEVGDWDRSVRSRLRAETIIPINKKTMFAGDNLWYGILDGEWFIVLDQDVEERFANRFRLRTGIGYRLSYNFRFEIIYCLQESRNTLGDDFYTSDSIFRFRVKQYLNKSKPAKEVGVGN